MRYRSRVRAGSAIPLSAFPMSGVRRHSVCVMLSEASGSDASDNQIGSHKDQGHRLNVFEVNRSSRIPRKRDIASATPASTASSHVHMRFLSLHSTNNMLEIIKKTISTFQSVPNLITSMKYYFVIRSFRETHLHCFLKSHENKRFSS